MDNKPPQVALFPVPHGLDQSKFPIKRAGSGYRVKETDEVLSEASCFDIVRCCLIIGIKCEEYTKENAFKNLKKYLDAFGCKFRASNDLDIKTAKFPVEAAGAGVRLLLAETINVRRRGRPKVVQADPSTVALSEASAAQLLECAAMLNIDCNDHSKKAVSKAIKDYLRTFRYTFQPDPFVICAKNPCMFPDCRFEPVAGCSCCSRAPHKRYAFLAKHRDEYEDLDPSGFGFALCESLIAELIKTKTKTTTTKTTTTKTTTTKIVARFSAKNKLQPNRNTTDPIERFFEKHFKDRKEKKFSNALELLEFYWPYIHLLKVFIAEVDSISFYPDQLPSISEEDPKVLNQQERARAMASEWKNRHERLPFMDGHGLILLFFLHELREIRNNRRLRHGDGIRRSNSGDRLLKRILLDWVDIDASVNDWHRIVFPCVHLKTFHRDIFDHVNKLLKDGEVSNDKLFVYFNFCGVTKSFERLVKFLGESELAVHFVSFSTARFASGLDQEFEKKMEDGNIDFEKIKLSDSADRTDFVTYEVAGLLR